MKEHQTAFVGLHNAYYKELKPAGPVKIKLTISDISSARERKEGRAGYRGEVTLSEERTVKEALSKAGFEIPTDVLDYAFYASLKELRLYINGSDVSNGGVTYGVDVRDVGFKIINSLDIQLHPGDDVHIALGFRAYTRVDQTIGSGPAFLHQYADSVKLSKFKEDETGAGIEVEAGKEFKLSTESMKAILGSDGTWSPAKGMSFLGRLLAACLSVLLQRADGSGPAGRGARAGARRRPGRGRRRPRADAHASGSRRARLHVGGAPAGLTRLAGAAGRPLDAGPPP